MILEQNGTNSREEFENLNIRIAEKFNKKYPYCFDIDLKTYTSTSERDIYGKK